MKTTYGNNFCHILLAFSETCDFFDFFLIFQNQRVAGNVIQQIKKALYGMLWVVHVLIILLKGVLLTPST